MFGTHRALLVSADGSSLPRHGRRPEAGRRFGRRWWRCACCVRRSMYGAASALRHRERHVRGVPRSWRLHDAHGERLLRDAFMRCVRHEHGLLAYDGARGVRRRYVRRVQRDRSDGVRERHLPDQHRHVRPDGRHDFDVRHVHARHGLPRRSALRADDVPLDGGWELLRVAGRCCGTWCTCG